MNEAMADLDGLRITPDHGCGIDVASATADSRT
jgi:hypothetical protein